MGTSAPTASTVAGSSRKAGCALLIARVARISGYLVGRSLAAARISGHEFAILHRLSEGGVVHQKELSRVLRLHPSNLVALIDQLEDAGLIVRRRDPNDRRRQRIALTASGERRLAQAKNAAAEAEAELLAPLSAAERRNLHSYLDRIADHGCRPSGDPC